MDKIANGDEVDPEKIRSEVIEASSGTKTGDLFRFATLLWSIPVSQGYTVGGFASRLRQLVCKQDQAATFSVIVFMTIPSSYLAPW